MSREAHGGRDRGALLVVCLWSFSSSFGIIAIAIEDVVTRWGRRSNIAGRNRRPKRTEWAFPFPEAQFGTAELS